MSNKLVKKSNLGDLSYSDLGLDVSFQILEAPYLEDGTKMLFKIDDVENFCAYNLNDFADFIEYSIKISKQQGDFCASFRYYSLPLPFYFVQNAPFTLL